MSSINIGSNAKPDSGDISEELIGTSDESLNLDSIGTETTTREESTDQSSGDASSTILNTNEQDSIASGSDISTEEQIEEAVEESNSPTLVDIDEEGQSTSIETQPLESSIKQSSQESATSTEEVLTEELPVEEEAEQLEADLSADTEQALPGSITVGENQLIKAGEDEVFDLQITPNLENIIESTVEIIISGLPDGASLSAGIDNGDGSYTLSLADLNNLQLTPKENSDEDFTLEVNITGQDELGISREGISEIDVDLTAIADAPTLDIQNSSGDEDSAIDINITSLLTDLDGSESLSIIISDVPEGASLSAGVDNGDGTYTLTQDQLEGLTITPPTDSDVDFSLNVTATSTDSNGDTESTSGLLFVDTNAVADMPMLVLNDSSGDEDTSIGLDITSALTDLDGSESLSIIISDVPEGASLSAGVDNGDGTWTLTKEDLNNLSITPPQDSDVDFNLTVTATATEENGDTASVSGNLFVDINSVADTPTLTLSDASGREDNAIALDISSATTDIDGSETLEVVISDVPAGASLSAGTDNGDGTWTLSEADLSGLTITPPENSDVDFSLTVTSTTTDTNGDQASTTDTLNVVVDAVADAPDLNLVDASGNEDSAISLNLTSALTDSDGSESLSVVISGVPAGATLSAGTDNGDGTWSLDQTDLAGLTVTPPEDSHEDFVLNVTATSTEADGGDSATVSGTINVDVNAVADAPTLVLSDAAGDEDTAIALDISSSLNDLDGSESLEVVISGVPTGASLSAGTDNGDGTWTLAEGDLSGLTITPPADSDTDFSLSVTATATDINGDTASVTDSLFVDINAVADAPNLAANDVSGDEDTAIALDISSTLNDLDGSESLSVVISGVPEGASLSAGVDNGDGTYTLTQEQLDGLTITPPANSDTDINLSVTATATDSNGDTATVTDSFLVDINAVADAL